MVRQYHVTPEAMGLVFIVTAKPKEENPFASLINLIPRKELLGPIKTLYSRFNEHKVKPKLDKSLIPEDSSLYTLFEEEEEDAKKTTKR